MRRPLFWCAAASPLALLVGWGAMRLDAGGSDDEPKPEAPPAAGRSAEEPKADRPAVEAAGRSSTTWTTAVEPKPLGESTRKGLAWLAEHQLPSGGWGQGEESAQMGGGGELKDLPSVGDTCAAALALIRSGSTPSKGPYRDAVAKAARFLCKEVEASDSQSILVTSAQGTRIQQKLGPNIDTFLASMFLAEIKGKMPTDKDNARVDKALAKVLAKIGKHQKEDGSFEGGGWAPVLAQAMCGKGINRAKQAGAAVPTVLLARAQRGATVAFESAGRPAAGAAGAAPAAGGFGRGGKMAIMGGGGDAGVELYSRAASLGVLSDGVNTGRKDEAQLREQAAQAPDAKDRDEAKRKLDDFAKVQEVQVQAQAAVVERLEDKQFVAGFGSNGGEEFLSYMTIGESLVVQGGDEWTKWDTSMGENLGRVQNGDGSWSGHHCITGRTFCTSAALLVLMTDRTPVPVELKEKGEGAKGK